MSSLQATSPSVLTGGRTNNLSSLSSGLMSQDGTAQEKPLNSALTAHEHARAIVRLIQCSQCSKPYRSPVTLPCGNSLCRSCLPASHRREHITYPDTPGRRRAIHCPYPTCAVEHPMADCSIDVTLSKVMESIAEVMARQRLPTRMDTPVASQTPMDVISSLANRDVLEKSIPSISTSGRLAATYLLAEAGGLAFDAQLEYESGVSVEDEKRLDGLVLGQLLETAQKELDCQVCYSLMLDPVTTGCGHTLCRKCLVRSLDHSQHCPVCRRAVLLLPSLTSQPSNSTLVDLLSGLCPEIVASRSELVAMEDSIGLGDLDTPLFVVTLGFPGCPTFLRIFEPRYRLMLRRALEGNRQFGMVMYNRFGAPQGDLGPTPFMEYGTLLRIENVQCMPDGTSIVEAKGVARFKVKQSGQLDGYTVGSVERVEDVPVTEEERLEVEETSRPEAAEDDIEGQVARMSTRELLMLGLDFIMRMQARSAPWLHERILQAYGGPPDDAAIFPYWFASILPISEDVKYQLLQTTSVRERLKITAMWTKHMESQRWYQDNACTVL